MKKIIFAAAMCLFFSPQSFAQTLAPATSSDSQSFDKAVEESHEAAQAGTHETADDGFGRAVAAEAQKETAEGENEKAEHSGKWTHEAKEKEDHDVPDSATVDQSDEHDDDVNAVGHERDGENEKGDSAESNSSHGD